MCQVIVRSRFARTKWELFCRSIVGDPVHMDVVLVKPKTVQARFCYSAYMQQNFDMIHMDRGLLLDESMENQVIDITETEFDACSRFMNKMVEKGTGYDYVDAMLLLPASKLVSKTVVSSAVVDTAPAKHNKVFCSQSVVLMLRECLESTKDARHRELVDALQGINSRIASPKDVYTILNNHPHTSKISNEELAKLANTDYAT